MIEALKPCPFCGSPAERGIFGSGKGHIVACSSAHCDGKIGMEMQLSREHAAKLWNTRAALEQPSTAEPVCRIVFNGTQYGIQDMNGNAFDMSEWPNTTLYTAPPSTAGRPSEEIKQRARDIEDAIAAGDMSAGQVYTQMWQLVDKASCESSTAEAQARAPVKVRCPECTKEWPEGSEQGVCVARHGECFSCRFIHNDRGTDDEFQAVVDEAKRIREEG